MEQFLIRFLDAQSLDFNRAMGEIESGRKTTHWMWHVFPQAKGLGSSERSLHFGISSIEEANAYLSHPVLGPRLTLATNLVIALQAPAVDVFGELDFKKLVSCMTLFGELTPPTSVFNEAMRHIGEKDVATIGIIKQWRGFE
ncbi:DUF1810 family protein [Stenotrophomonas sp.]|uniref:DUF1810 domain-containing protein n=1 Tax=Stenotrophomonas sp. TaxID=69392 RepID=UPI0028A1F59B|nr:DUF1810 family protein [Stenotrophomonas sp.]